MTRLALIALIVGLSGFVLVFLGFMIGFIPFIIIGAIAMPLALITAFITLIYFIIRMLIPNS